MRAKTTLAWAAVSSALTLGVLAFVGNCGAPEPPPPDNTDGNPPDSNVNPRDTSRFSNAPGWLNGTWQNRASEEGDPLEQLVFDNGFVIGRDDYLFDASCRFVPYEESASETSVFRFATTLPDYSSGSCQGVGVSWDPRDTAKCSVSATDGLINLVFADGLLTDQDTGDTWYPVQDGLPPDVNSKLAELATDIPHDVSGVVLDDKPLFSSDSDTTSKSVVSSASAKRLSELFAAAVMEGSRLGTVPWKDQSYGIAYAKGARNPDKKFPKNCGDEYALDCSAFVSLCFGLPGKAYHASQLATAATWNNLNLDTDLVMLRFDREPYGSFRTGDILCWKDGSGNVTHVGIAVLGPWASDTLAAVAHFWASNGDSAECGEEQNLRADGTKRRGPSAVPIDQFLSYFSDSWSFGGFLRFYDKPRAPSDASILEFAGEKPYDITTDIDFFDLSDGYVPQHISLRLKNAANLKADGFNAATAESPALERRGAGAISAPGVAFVDYKSNATISKAKTFTLQWEVRDADMDNTVISTVEQKVNVICAAEAPVVQAEQSTTLYQGCEQTIKLPFTPPACVSADPVVEIVADPQHGAVRQFGSSWLYKPQDGYLGDDSLRYQVSVADVASDVGTLKITIAQRPAPVAGPASGSVQAGQNTQFLVPVVFTGELDYVDVQVTPPAHGSVNLVATTTDGVALQYNAHSGYSGSDAFNCVVTHCGVESNPVTVTVTITDSNPPPDCGNGTCDSGEMSESCPADCPPDSTCDAGSQPCIPDTSRCCPADCPYASAGDTQCSVNPPQGGTCAVSDNDTTPAPAFLVGIWQVYQDGVYKGWISIDADGVVVQQYSAKWNCTGIYEVGFQIMSPSESYTSYAFPPGLCVHERMPIGACDYDSTRCDLCDGAGSFNGAAILRWATPNPESNELVLSLTNLLDRSGEWSSDFNIGRLQNSDLVFTTDTTGKPMNMVLKR